MTMLARKMTAVLSALLLALSLGVTASVVTAAPAQAVPCSYVQHTRYGNYNTPIKVNVGGAWYYLYAGENTRTKFPNYRCAFQVAWYPAPGNCSVNMGVVGTGTSAMVANKVYYLNGASTYIDTYCYY